MRTFAPDTCPSPLPTRAARSCGSTRPSVWRTPTTTSSRRTSRSRTSFRRSSGSSRNRLRGSMLTLAMVGYTAGLIRRRSLVTAVVLIVVLGAVITLIIDLDRPRDGFLVVSQQPLIDTQNQMDALQ